MRLLAGIVLTLLLCGSVLAQKIDEDAEALWIETIQNYAASVSSMNAACEAESPRCDKKRLEEVRAELQAALKRAQDDEARLSRLVSSETEAAVKQKLSTRNAALLGAIALAQKTLGPKPVEDAEKLEKELAARIKSLVKSVVEMTANCEKKEPSCSLDQLARDRFALRDAMTRAIAIDNTILGDMKKATLLETPKLAERHLRLLDALEPARKISFAVHEDRGEADELVDRLKALDEKLTNVEKERRDAEKAAKAAKKTQQSSAADSHAPTPVNYAEPTKPDADELRNQEAELRTKLAELESKARQQALADRQRMGKIDEDLKSGRLNIPHNELVNERKLLTNRLGALESLVTVPADGNPLYRVHDDDYEDWWIHQFYLGGEFDSVSGVLNRGFARVGYSSWLHAGGENIPESHPRSGWGNYGRTWIFNALLTSSAEQKISKLLSTPETTDPCAPNSTSTDKCIRRALETDQTLWLPMYRTHRHNRLRWYLGPVVSIGATFVDPDKNDSRSLQAAYRYYGGMRTGFARDAYAEVLYGKTNTLQSRRLEIRGEIPVAKWGAKSRLLLGWTANIRAGGREAFTRVREVDDQGNVTQQIIPERDVYRVYVVYELDFLTLTGLQPPK